MTFPPTAYEVSFFAAAIGICDFSDDSHLTGMRFGSHCALGLHLTLADVEHLLMCLLDVCILSLERCLSSSSAHFFFSLSCMRCLYILDINPLSVIPFENSFSHSVGCLFILLMASFAMQKLLSLIRPHLVIFPYISFTFALCVCMLRRVQLFVTP